MQADLLTEQQELRRKTAWFAVYAVACALLFLNPLRDLFRLALSTDIYSHILVIPFISAALLYMERKKIFQLAAGKSRIASFFFAAGFFFCLLVNVMLSAASLPREASMALTILSLLFLIWSGFSWFYGDRVFYAALFPLLLLVLMLPPPTALLDRFIFLLQSGSAEVTHWIFQMTGTPVMRQGFIFALPGVTIEVAKECSGIRSTMALLVTCLTGGYLLLRTAWARTALLLIALPVMILKNGIRITTLTLLAIHVDSGFLFGRLHQQGGFVFFGLAFAILLPALWWLQRMEDRNRAPLSASLFARLSSLMATRLGN